MLQTVASDAVLPIDERGLGLGVWQLTHALGVAIEGRLCTMLWRRDIDETSYQIQADAIALHASRNRGSAVYQLVIETAGVPPDDASRRRFSALIKRYQRDIDAVCCVLEMGGFGASVVRGILQSLRLLGGGFAFPLHFAANTDDGFGWLAARQPFDVARARMALDYMREVIPPRV